MTISPELRAAYLDLLERRGLAPLYAQLPADFVQGVFLRARANDDTSREVDPKLARLLEPYERADNPMQAILESIAIEVEDSAALAHLNVGNNIFAGLYPTGSVNAQSRKEGTGFLILINRGLMSLAYMALKVNVLSASVAGDGGLISRDEVASLIAELVYAYMMGADPAKGRQLPVVTGRRKDILGTVIRRCEKFIVAHEFGHAIAGHLDSNPAKITETQGGELLLIQKTWEQEFEADKLALDIVLAGYDPKSDDDPRHFDVGSRIGGVMFFLVIDTLMRTLKEKLVTLPAPSIVSDHPPPAERAARIFALSKSRSLPIGALDLPEAYVLWGNSIANDVATIVADQIAAGRPGH